MSASQDKVQGILQTLLEQNLPLVHKGIFTQQQLQSAMCQRQKHENNMLRSTYKLSDYLKAIEFEYNLERLRRSRLQLLAPTNPLFKKQTKTDFVIIRRIIRLWDRTMHKFKYNLQLWKQYLDFCIKAGSKNQFYKALSNALRFLPFSQDLWLIGVQYEIQIGLNLWKARKIFIKALRMNQKKVSLWLSMFKFQITFLKTIHQRQKAISGDQTMHFITNQQNDQQKEEQQNQDDNKKMSSLNLQQHDDILYFVYEQSSNKVLEENKNQIRKEMLSILKQNIKKQKDQQIIKILKSAHKKIQGQATQNKKVEQSEPPIAQNIGVSNLSRSSMTEKLQYYQAYLAQNNMLTIADLDKIVCQFLTKPDLVTSLITHYLQINIKDAINYLINTNKFKIYNLPAELIRNIIIKFKSVIESQKQQSNKQKYSKIVLTVIRNINTNKYLENLSLLETVIKTNKSFKNFKTNNDIYRSISVLCKGKPEIVERCMHWIHQPILY